MHGLDAGYLTIFLCFLASLAAGTIDSIVGGGGLILLPSIFALFPTAAPATLFGTNKVAAISGTATAAWRYCRHVRLNWKVILPAILVAWAGSTAGAWAITHVDGNIFRKILPFILAAVFIYTLTQKQLGLTRSKNLPLSREVLYACLAGGVVGFYDGFFGPGTGSFFIFLFVQVLGYDFLMASAASKLLNTTSNLSAIFLFAFHHDVWWGLGLVMGAANISGSLIGTQLAVKHGAGFVRKFFIVIVGVLILSTIYKAFF